MIDPHQYVPPAAAQHRAARSAPPRVALAHDWLVGYRGGEAVLDRIARVILSNAAPASLNVLFASPDPFRGFPTDSPLHRFAPLNTPALSRLTFAQSLRRWLLPAYPFLVSSLSRTLARERAHAPIDLLVSTSSSAIKGLRPPKGVPHVCYCHAPARYLWDPGAEYAVGSGGTLRRLGLSLLGPALRHWDRTTANNVTTFIANSTHTRSQIRRAFDRDAIVIHPPVRTDFFTPDPSARRTGAWLFVGALEPYKRADAAIRAAVHAKAELIIVGEGSQSAALRALARELAPAGQVRFTGRASDAELRRLYQTSSVLIFPQVEDFGIVAAEALACGLPIAARRAGGALDILHHPSAGVFFDTLDPEHIARAAHAASTLGSDAARADSAQVFSVQRFDQAIAGMLGPLLAGAATSTA